MVGLMAVFFTSDTPTPGLETSQAAADAVLPPEPAKSAPNKLLGAQNTSSDFDSRWLPNDCRVAFSFTLSDLAGQSGTDRLLASLGPCATAAIVPAIEGLGLELNQISRLTLAATDVEALTSPKTALSCGLIVIRLEPNVDPNTFANKGSLEKLTIDGIACRRLHGSKWPHPHAVFPGQQTIVTGPDRLLRELDGRGKASFTSHPIARLIKTADPASNFIAMLDMAEARRKRLVDRTERLFAVWPSGRRAWQTICKAPVGAGLNLRWTPGVQADIALVCPDKTDADQLDAQLAVIIAAAKTALPARIRELEEQLNSGAVTHRWARGYEVFLRHLTAAIHPVRRDVVDDVVWIHTSLEDDPVSTALTAMDAAGPAKTDWLSAGLARDREKQHKIVSGLNDYARTNGEYPAGAVGGTLLPPETRLSWLASLLPYIEQGTMHRRLQFGYSWDSEQNTPVTKKPLAAVLNPTLKRAKTDDGFPVTHYVGISGVGRDAGLLNPGDPRAGLFGFRRSADARDIPDGGSNTIAVLGVSGQLGPWAAGGHPTVRSLTQRPYVNGPDGFGSGQPGGMLAGMADGSTRFLSKDIDPRILEQMATTHGSAAAGVVKVTAAKPVVSSDAVSCGPTSERNMPATAKARLKERLISVNFQNAPLFELVEFIEQMASLGIDFDDRAMSRQGVSRKVAVSVDLADATVAEILEAVLAPHGLSYVARGDRLLITPLR